MPYDIRCLPSFSGSVVLSCSTWYPFPPLYPGILIKRYKRFFAEIQLESGAIITAHCANTGPMTGVNVPGQPVMVSRSENAKRSLPYTWELIALPDISGELTWVGVNTSLPNRVVKAALEARLFPELGTYQEIRSEVPYGQDRKSRVDFLLNPGQGAADTRSIYIEVKNTTWAIARQALFPDTVTTRGQKHLRELMDLLPQARAVMLYFINRGDCFDFAPGDSADPLYGSLLRQAIARGLEVLPCRFASSPQGMCYEGLATLSIPTPPNTSPQPC